MDINKILSKCDHTLLSRTATWEDIKNLCDDAVKYHCASVCIPPCFVKKAALYAKGAVKICTVIGFPNGYNTLKTKLYETEQAILDGADEIDTVINVCDVKEKKYDAILAELKELKEACRNKILKVIIETCLLTEEEKIEMCRVVSMSGADYIKTSTGFSTGGATPEDVALMRKYCAPKVKIKAAGGISTIEDAEKMIIAGADRLGTSRLVKIAKALNASK